MFGLGHQQYLKGYKDDRYCLKQGYNSDIASQQLGSLQHCASHSPRNRLTQRTSSSYSVGASVGREGQATSARADENARDPDFIRAIKDCTSTKQLHEVVSIEIEERSLSQDFDDIPVQVNESDDLRVRVQDKYDNNSRMTPVLTEIEVRCVFDKLFKLPRKTNILRKKLLNALIPDARAALASSHTGRVVTSILMGTMTARDKHHKLMHLAIDAIPRFIPAMSTRDIANILCVLQQMRFPAEQQLLQALGVQFIKQLGSANSMDCAQFCGGLSGLRQWGNYQWIPQVCEHFITLPKCKGREACTMLWSLAQTPDHCTPVIVQGLISKGLQFSNTLRAQDLASMMHSACSTVVVEKALYAELNEGFLQKVNVADGRSCCTMLWCWGVQDTGVSEQAITIVLERAISQVNDLNKVDIKQILFAFKAVAASHSEQYLPVVLGSLSNQVDTLVGYDISYLLQLLDGLYTAKPQDCILEFAHACASQVETLVGQTRAQQAVVTAKHLDQFGVSRAPTNNVLLHELGRTYSRFKEGQLLDLCNLVVKWIEIGHVQPDNRDLVQLGQRIADQAVQDVNTLNPNTITCVLWFLRCAAPNQTAAMSKLCFAIKDVLLQERGLSRQASGYLDKFMDGNSFTHMALTLYEDIRAAKGRGAEAIEGVKEVDETAQGLA